MARSRNIKPDFFKDERIADCEPIARILLIGLGTIADRSGRLEDRPRRIKAEVLPHDYTVDIDPLLSQLDGNGLIERYDVGGQPFIQINGWADAQSPHMKEPVSTIPAPGENVTSTGQAPDKPDASSSTAALIPDSPSLIPDSPSLIPDSIPVASPPVITIPLVGNAEHAVTQADIDDWRKAYPTVDVPQQLAEMRAWCMANTVNRKTARGVGRFIVGWLSREQDKGPWPAGIIAMTVPSRPGKDPALAKIEEDRKRARPPTDYERSEMRRVRGAA